MKPKAWLAGALVVVAAAVAVLAFDLPRPVTARPQPAPAQLETKAVAQPAPGPAPAAAAADPERELFTQAEAALDVDPPRALGLLSEGDARFPAGPLAHERQFLKLRARVNLNEIAEARVDATRYLEHNPKSPVAGRIHRLLGIRPPPELSAAPGAPR